MKRFIFFSAALLCLSVFASAQQRAAADLPEYTFTTVKAAPITPIKNQASSGTCWSFSAISFLESEAIRLGNIQDESKYPDFSEFYVVSNSYKERAEKFIRLGCGEEPRHRPECGDDRHELRHPAPAAG